MNPEAPVTNTRIEPGYPLPRLEIVGGSILLEPRGRAVPNESATPKRRFRYEGSSKMGILDRLFGGRGGGTSSGADVETTVSTLIGMYDDPEVKSDGGLSVTGRHANEVRALGRELHKAGGKPQMEAARDALRDRLPWAGSNLEAIWASLPEWRG